MTNICKKNCNFNKLLNCTCESLDIKKNNTNNTIVVAELNFTCTLLNIYRFHDFLNKLQFLYEDIRVKYLRSKGIFYSDYKVKIQGKKDKIIIIAEVLKKELNFENN